MRVHFVNENLGGHATMHLAIRRSLDPTEIQATFFDVPPPSLARKMFAGPIPVLGPLDLDLHPLRDQLGKSAVVRRHLRRRLPMEPPIDALHVYTHNVALLSTDLLRRVPSVVSFDSTNEQNAYRLPQRHPTRFTPLALRPTKWLERRVYDAASLIVAQSQWGASSLADYGVDRDRVRVVNFGIEMTDVPHRGNDGLPRIVFVGRSMDRKGGAQLLELWRESLRDRATLTLVTPEPVAAEPGLEVLGDVRPGDGRLPEVLASSDVFVFPTKMDSFPYAAIEAMGAGLPVVANRTAAVPEIVADGVTGLLVDVDRPGELLDAVRRLVDDAALRRDMGTAGRARARQRFDARVTTAQLVEVLREAIERGPRCPDR